LGHDFVNSVSNDSSFSSNVAFFSLASPSRLFLLVLLVDFGQHLKDKIMPLRPPFPPFNEASAIEKVRLAEDGWNTRDPEKVAAAYSADCRWRNRSEFIAGTAEIISFLTRKWAKELDYHLVKELWAFGSNRIAVRFAYEWHDHSSNWFRSYGNENWEFGSDGLMIYRHASINDLPIRESERLFQWPAGRRPDDHAGLSALGL